LEDYLSKKKKKKDRTPETLLHRRVLSWINVWLHFKNGNGKIWESLNLTLELFELQIKEDSLSFLSALHLLFIRCNKLPNMKIVALFIS
jgi:hypothetical protein